MTDQPESIADLESLGDSVRRTVLGDAHVDRSYQGLTSFSWNYRDYANRVVWGSGWARPGIETKLRSLFTVVITATIGADDEFMTHVRGALRQGATEEEIAEALIQVSIYAGAPRGAHAFQLAQKVIAESGAEGEVEG